MYKLVSLLLNTNHIIPYLFGEKNRKNGINCFGNMENGTDFCFSWKNEPLLIIIGWFVSLWHSSSTAYRNTKMECITCNMEIFKKLHMLSSFSIFVVKFNLFIVYVFIMYPIKFILPKKNSMKTTKTDVCFTKLKLNARDNNDNNICIAQARH